MTVKKLEKVSEEEMKSVNPTKVEQLVPEVTAEVEGQDPYVGRVECPWCGTVSRVILDTDYYKYFSCGNCGRPARGRHGA